MFYSAILSYPQRILIFLRHRLRILIALLTFITVGSVMNAVDAFTYTMNYMEKDNATMNITYHGFRLYNANEKAWMISMMAVGNLIGLYPFSLMFERFGARFVLFGACVLCAVTTALLPYSLDSSFYFAIAVRILQGISFAADCGVVGLVTSQWSPLSELGIFLAIVGSFTALKGFIALPIMGKMVEVYDWRSPHYVLAGIVFGCSIVWLIVYRDNPADFRFISKEEILAIQKDKSDAHNQMKIKVPVKKVIISVRVWAVWISGFADTYSSFVFFIYGPTFIKLLGYSPSEVSLYAALCGYAYLVVKLLSGLAADKITCISEFWKLRIFSTISLQLPALSLVIIAFLPSSEPGLIVGLVIALCGFVGANVGAFYRGGAMISRQYAHFVLGQVQLFKALSVLLIPPLYRACVPNEDYSEFRLFFLINVGFFTIGNIVFLFLASSKPEPFTFEDDRSEDTEDPRKDSLLISDTSEKPSVLKF